MAMKKPIYTQTGRRIVALVVATCVSLAFILYGCGGGVEVKNSVDEYTWEELSKISEEIGKTSSEDAAVDVAKKYNLTNSNGQLDGSQVKNVQLSNGQTVQVQIVGFRHDDKTSGGKAGISFIFKDAIAEHSMNPTYTNAGGWEESQMRSWLASDGMNMLPSELSGKIVEVNKLSNNTGDTQSVASVTETSDKLWLFSTTELFGDIFLIPPESPYAYYNDILNAEGSEYKLFRDQAVSSTSSNDVLTKTYSGSSANWWGRSAYPGSSRSFEVVYLNGSPAGDGDAPLFFDVVPGFCI